LLYTYKHSLQKNILDDFLRYNPTYFLCSGTGGVDGDAGMCEQHPKRGLKYYCEDCKVNICDSCVEQTDCSQHHCSSVAAIAERLRQGLDTSFTTASTHISRKKTELEGKLRALADEKDRALLKIDSAFESHAHTLARRATLLKNKVIDIYNENAAALESGLEEIDTAMTCVVSLREYYDAAVARGDFASVTGGGGSAEIDEVAHNISDRVRPPEVHLVFDGDHGADKFRSCTKDLGRVVCNRSKINIMNAGCSDGRPALMSSNSDGALQSPEGLTEDASQVEKCKVTDELACGDGSCFDGSSSVQQDSSSYATTERVVVDGRLIAETNCQLNNESTYKDSRGAGDPRQPLKTSVERATMRNQSTVSPVDCEIPAGADGSSTAKMSIPAKEEDCAIACPYESSKNAPSSVPRLQASLGNMTGTKNNNYCRSVQPLDTSGFLNSDEIPMTHRSHLSYDEQHLRRELDTFSVDNDAVSAAARLSQSDFWNVDDGQEVTSYNEEHGSVIAELSGEQTSL
jgi:hypothetical protein